MFNWSFVIIIFGLALFEIISSVDNAVINAHVLKTLPQKFRRFFLTWGLLIAVVLVRGLLPFIIVWLANTNLSFTEVITVAWSGSDALKQSLEASKPFLLLGGGIYLYLVFLAWLFLEEKKYAFLAEHFIHHQSVWFYAVSSLSITLIIYYAIQLNPFLALAASIGATAFFITDGFKRNAEAKEKELLNPHFSAWSKILFLEIIDASFSIDGVVGAFAFTLSVPLIILGNGLGTLIVRELTVRGMKIISKFAYLKNGAMYTIGILGFIMMLEAFGHNYPFWLSPLNTVIILAIFLFLSHKELQEAGSKNGIRK